MSIIADALKKVQVSREKIESSPKIKHKKQLFKIIFIVLWSLLVSAFVYVFLKVEETKETIVIETQDTIPKTQETKWGATPYSGLKKRSGVSTPTQEKTKDKPVAYGAFTLPSAVSDTEPNFMVTGIMYTEMSPRVVINGRILKLGDIIDNYRVVNIYRNSVVVEKDEEKIELLLN